MLQFLDRNACRILNFCISIHAVVVFRLEEFENAHLPDADFRRSI